MKTIPTVVSLDPFVLSNDGVLITDASSIGLAPGVIPEQLRVKDEGREVGNGQPFDLLRATSMYFKYQQRHGVLTLTVWND